jgi:hypothetical protein
MANLSLPSVNLDSNFTSSSCVILINSGNSLANYNFCCKGPDSKYFRLGQLLIFIPTYFAVYYSVKTARNRINDSGCTSIKLYLQRRSELNLVIRCSLSIPGKIKPLGIFLFLNLDHCQSFTVHFIVNFYMIQSSNLVKVFLTIFANMVTND